LAIRWIVFDAVGTLMYPTPKVAKVYYDLAKAHGSQLSEREIAQRFAVSFAASEQADLGTTTSLLVKPTTNEEREVARWKEIVAEVVCDLDDTSGCFEELFEHFGNSTAWNVFDDVAETIARLSAAGYELAIASNFDRRLHSVCDGHPVLSQIPHRFVSSEIGYRKPAIAFYSAIVDACGGKAGETLMVGDGLVNDVQGALDAGWQAVHVDRTSTAIGVESKQYSVVRALTEIERLVS
jgi:putative hydrolase of the HAD superfamily